MTRAPQVGDRVEDFSLPDETGTVRTLSELLDDGPVVLFFYPAALTPGCTAEACHFRDLAAEFAEAGARPSASAGTPSTASRSSPGATPSACRCCPTRTARSGSGSA